MTIRTEPMPSSQVQAYANADMPASVAGAQRLAREVIALRELVLDMIASPLPSNENDGCHWCNVNAFWLRETIHRNNCPLSMAIALLSEAPRV